MKRNHGNENNYTITVLSLELVCLQGPLRLYVEGTTRALLRHSRIATTVLLRLPHFLRQLYKRNAQIFRVKGSLQGDVAAYSSFLQ